MEKNIDPAEVARVVFRHTLALTKELGSSPKAKRDLDSFGEDLTVHASKWIVYFLAYVLGGKKSLDSMQAAYINRIIGQQYSTAKLNSILSKGIDGEIGAKIGQVPFFLALGKKLDDQLYREILDNVEQLAFTAIILDDREESDELARMEEVLAPIREALSRTDSKTESDNHPPLQESSVDGSEDQRPEQAKSETRSFNTVMAEINAMTGLAAVKKEVASLANLVKYQQQRKLHKLPNAPLSLHLVFTGNPGTGKTTVARLVAEVFQSLGVLSRGHLVETDRSGMIAEYMGQTAVKVKQIVHSSMDGVLFIDEAYSLVPESDEDSYGEEAISTLLKLMEDHRERLAVIVAGYTEEMTRFIETNPGLRSRFNRYIHFDDYTPEQLAEIFLGMCKKNRYKLPSPSRTALSRAVLDVYSHRGPTFGNAREMRNLFERVVQNIANRLAQLEKPTKADLVTILSSDFA